MTEELEKQLQELKDDLNEIKQERKVDWIKAINSSHIHMLDVDKEVINEINETFRDDHFILLCSMYELGYMRGKRAERARRHHE